MTKTYIHCIQISQANLSTSVLGDVLKVTSDGKHQTYIRCRIRSLWRSRGTGGISGAGVRGAEFWMCFHLWMILVDVQYRMLLPAVVFVYEKGNKKSSPLFKEKTFSLKLHLHHYSGLCGEICTTSKAKLQDD